MKMNKLAAGALALALGLGAVAPAVASENGTRLIEAEYNEQLARAQKFFDLRKDARKKLEVAEARYDAAKKAQKAAKDKYDNLPEDKPGEVLPSTETAWEASLKTAKDAVTTALNELNELKKDEKKNKAAIETKEAEIKKLTADLDKLATQYGEWSKKQRENLPDFDKAKLAPKAQAYVDLMKANEELANAYAAYGVAVNNEYEANNKYQHELGLLKTWAEGADKIVKIEGTKIVVKEAKKTKSVAEAVKALKASVEDNKAAVKSAEFLLKFAPKSVAKVKAKLEAQIATAKAAIEKGEAALAKVEKKMAFVAVAYADEDVKVEDLEALTKENKDSAADINNTIKDNEKEQPAVEEEKKPEEKKPEENKPARKAGKNAKTGIAGIAGVAGILAAASVAYAASKRD